MQGIHLCVVVCGVVLSGRVFVCVTCSNMFTPERHLPTPGQRGHSPQRHTAAGTAAHPTTVTVNTVPQRANPKG